jgi:predicted PurR-regulated permease PerM
MAQYKQLHHVGRPVIIGLVGLLGLWIISSFLPALLWALVIAVAIDPLYRRLEKRCPRRGHGSLLPALVTLAVALLVLLPIAAGIVQAAREAHDVTAWIASARDNGIPVPSWISRLPIGSDEVARWWQANLATPEGTKYQLHRLETSTLIANTRLLGGGLVHRLVIFTFTLITLFFLLRDRETISAQAAIAGEHLLGPSGERIGSQIFRSMRGTIDGLVLVGIGEGAAMAIFYLIAGVPHPLLLGSLTAVAAMIPFGAAFLFGVAGLLLMMRGAIGMAIMVVIAGLIVVGIADHIVRPVLIGGATRLPFLWVLIGILGGVECFGLLGLFVGPATMAVLIMLWREFVDPATM